MAKKQKSNLDYASEIQKFLKRLSIEFKFVDSISIWCTEGGRLAFSTYINNFFYMTGFIDSTFKDYSEKFAELIGKDKKFIINFKDEKFLQLKKSLKKNLSDLKDLKIKFSVEGIETVYEIEENKIQDKLYESLPAVYSKTFQINESFGNILKCYDGEDKVLEISKKDIYGYESGNLLYFIAETNDKGVFDGKLNYSSNGINFNLYFKVII